MSNTKRSIEPIAPGRQFGRYTVGQRLARGGMGEVWLASAHGPGGFQKRVVIKTVLPDLVAKPGYVEMLVREASLSAQLDHQNIVQVFDLGCIGGLYYIAMEYLSGRTLAQILRRACAAGVRIPVPALVTMMAACCDGLEYAHARADADGKPLGLLHRDISPSNIMVTFAGRVALLDFGVATASRGRFASQGGQIKGKFHYLAPERVRGEPHDRRSDLYALGVVMYQCLTLRWPFRARNDYQLLREIANDEPPMPRDHAPWVAPGMERIVMRAMARSPEDRYPTAAALAADLREYARSTAQVMAGPELATYLCDLFAEEPEVRALGTPPTAVSPVLALEEEPVDAVDPVEPIETVENSDGIEIDFQGSEVAAEMDIGGADLFPEPTRMTAATGATDVFSGYGRRRRKRTLSGPAFFGVAMRERDKG
ncbi:MAG TPA: serine/threonine-protein kinase [Kofleriaceae bacterium]|nr:serine/threonine-protein kinase [Kofleriaceae bacterium]